MNNKIWDCPICDYKTTNKNLKDQHVHEEFDKKYDELEKLSTETAKDNIGQKLEELFGKKSTNSGSFISGYKNIVNLYKSV